MLESPTDMDCQPARLKRTLTLPYVVLYGLGVTIGAGIYVLVKAARRRPVSSRNLAHEY